MKLHTLGPDSTDSARAARIYQNDHDVEIILHDSFEEILLQLDEYSGEQILMPVAFKSKKYDHLNWADINYLKWQQLQMIDVFDLPLLPLIILENTKYNLNIARTHAATEGLLKQFLQDEHLDDAWGPSITFSSSKPKVYDEFQKHGERFALISKPEQFPKAEYIIRQELQPKMVWVVYQVA
ncbi:MAG: hypothetical protein ACTMH7_05270 [Leuconostoc fallax]